MELEEKARRDLLAQGSALWEIRQTEGFRVLERTMRARAAQAALAGMADVGEDAKPVEWWRGYVQACRDVVGDVDAVIERANELKEEAAEEGREIVGVRIGRGDGMLAAEEA